MTNDKAADLFKAMATKAGFTPEQVNLALAAPEWKEIENRDNRHSEYSSALDKAKNLETKLQAAEPFRQWWQEKGGAQWYQNSNEQAQELARFKERYGDLDPNNPSDVRQAATASGLTLAQAKAMLDEQRTQLGVQFTAMTTDALAVMTDAQQRGIKLTTDDIGAMNRIMAEKGVTYGQAYETHLGPRVREMEQTKLTREKEEYAAEKVRDALSRVGHNGLPADSAGVQTGFFDRPANGMADKPRSDQELMAMWADAAPGKAAA